MFVIKTDQPIFKNKEKITQKIGKFWDQLSIGWRMVWGPHIHHGLYDSQAIRTPLEAQERLIEKLSHLSEIKLKDKILDVGCGMAGSSIYLAKKYQSMVEGITLSPRQVTIAREQASLEKVTGVNFKIEDAQSLASFEESVFDIVWSLESCEQFFDKPLFLKQAFRVLKPGGKLMLATWCADQDQYVGLAAKQYRKLCTAFDLPYMPTMQYYANSLKKENFNLHIMQDWSSLVKKSWDIGITLMSVWSVFRILKVSGLRGFIFAKQIKMMQQAFRENRVKYGVFIASKPN